MFLSSVSFKIPILSNNILHHRVILVLETINSAAFSLNTVLKILVENYNLL